MKVVLLPCSICGGKGIVKSMDPINRRGYRFKCGNCGLCNERNYSTREEASEAWNNLHAPKQREVEGVIVPPGFTIVPSYVYHLACQCVKIHNPEVYRKLTPYNIWHHNDDTAPPPLDGVQLDQH